MPEVTTPAAPATPTPAAAAPTTDAQFIAAQSAEPKEPVDARPATPPASNDTPIVAEAAPVDERVDEGEGDESPADAPSDDDAPAEREEAGAGEADVVPEPSPDLVAALKKQGIKQLVDDLPEALRPVVTKRLKEMEAPFTKAMQDARAYRKDEVALRAEMKFFKEHPVDAMLEMLTANPSLSEALNARIDAMSESPSVKAAEEIVIRDRRTQAVAAVQTTMDQADARAAGLARVTAYTEQAAQKAGVPAALGVQDAVDAYLALHGDITRSQIDAIVKDKAAVYQRLTRAQKRDGQNQYLKAKIEDRNTAGLKVKPGTGTAPAPGAPAKPTTDKEFIAMMSAKLAGV